MTGPRRHLMFVLLHPGFIRHYATTLAALAEDGHRVTITFESARNKIGERAQIHQLLEKALSIQVVPFPETTTDRWHYLTMAVRLLQDYARYFDPLFKEATALQARAAEQLPPALARLCAALCRYGWSRRLFARLLCAIERAAALNPAIHEFIRGLAPDVLLVTPLVDWASDQVHCLKSAAALGIPSALCVASWDNLTNKGAIRFAPTRVIVWNEAQLREAVDVHGMAEKQVVVTGAQTFDHWFGRQPSRSREAFCESLGLHPGQAILLYLGSSFFIAPDEAQFFDRFLRAMRQSPDARLRNANVVVRPHPLNIQQWLAFDYADLGRVAVFPKSVGAEAFTESFRSDFFDSLFHSAVVVGVNTSAMIEAGIVGRPVFTVLAPEFQHSQAGTIHFQHLTSEAGGVARTAPGIAEALDGITYALDHPAEFTAQAHRYIASFVRPRGWETPAAVHLQREILGLAGPLSPRLAPRLVTLQRLALLAPAQAAMLLLQPTERRKTRRKGPLGLIDGFLVRTGFSIALHVVSMVFWVWRSAVLLAHSLNYAYRHARRLVKRTWQDAGHRVARTGRRFARAKVSRPRAVVKKPGRRVQRWADDQMKAMRRAVNQAARVTQRVGRRSVRRVRYVVGRILSVRP